MPFIPHTEEDIVAMLKTIGVATIAQLFDEIPNELSHVSLQAVPEGLSEMALRQAMQERAKKEVCTLNFLGAGAYEHHIPSAVWSVATRGEFYSAYTPYQAEASQGSLQLIYEYQSMMANLMSMEVSNASLYDGASAFAEAVLMAVRLTQHAHKTKVLVPRSLHPLYRLAATTIVKQQQIHLIDIPYDPKTGRVDMAALNQVDLTDVGTLVIPQPNFFGVLEEVDQLTDWAESHHLLSVAIVNPLSMALLKPPGQWGKQGVDIACGEGQPLGIPLSGGGPYFGFMCCRKAHVRQMPGRIVGQTTDQEGKVGYVLTLQAREQHIRRAKATSNICTNQGLMVTAATIYMSLMGPKGLRQVAMHSHQKMKQLQMALQSIAGIEKIFANTPCFHEMVFRVDQSLDPLIAALAKIGVQAGLNLEAYYPELKNCLLLCATETKTEADIQYFAEQLQVLLVKKKVSEERIVACPV